MSRTSTRIAAVAVLAALLGTSSTAAAASESNPSGPTEAFRVQVAEATGSTETLGIDANLYLPSGDDPAPAVLLAHGFGGSKRDLNGDAERLRDDGYVVLSYSARGFGDSGGRISLDSLDFEVADARALVDLLGARPEVESIDGDPLVGVVGASYGGALALMLGATDERIDTVVAAITGDGIGVRSVKRGRHLEETFLSMIDAERTSR